MLYGVGNRQRWVTVPALGDLVTVTDRGGRVPATVNGH